MTTEYRSTREEEAYWRLSRERKGLLSEAARTVLDEAHSGAYADNLVHNVCLQPEEYDEAMDRMRLAAGELADRDRKLLARLWRAALAAAASLDPDGYPGNLYWYYMMASGMVERVLREKEMEEHRKADAEREPVEDLPDDVPFWREAGGVCRGPSGGT